MLISKFNCFPVQFFTLGGEGFGLYSVLLRAIHSDSPGYVQGSFVAGLRELYMIQGIEATCKARI